MDGAIFLNHSMLYLSKLKDCIWTVRFNSGFKLKIVFGPTRFKLKDRVGRCSLTKMKLKDRVWTMHFNFWIFSQKIVLDDSV